MYGRPGTNLAKVTHISDKPVVEVTGQEVISVDIVTIQLDVYSSDTGKWYNSSFPSAPKGVLYDKLLDPPMYLGTGASNITDLAVDTGNKGVLLGNSQIISDIVARYLTPEQRATLLKVKGARISEVSDYDADVLLRSSFSITAKRKAKLTIDCVVENAK